MNKLSKEKKMHLMLVAMATAGVIAGLWFVLISSQNAKIGSISKDIKNTQQQIDKVKRVQAEAEQTQAALDASTAKLAEIEATMPSGDLYSWVVSTVRQFNVPSYKVDLPQIGVPILGEVHMFPSYPYHQATISIGGTAYFYEFGKFLADFENHFPYMRVQNLNLEPGGVANPDEREKLSFRMDIVTLVKTNSF